MRASTISIFPHSFCPLLRDSFVGNLEEYQSLSSFFTSHSIDLSTLFAPPKSNQVDQSCCENGRRFGPPVFGQHTDRMALKLEYRISAQDKLPTNIHHLHHWTQNQFPRENKYVAKSWAQRRPYELFPWRIQLSPICDRQCKRG